ncbi:4,5-DOPA dioxygenase extradiol [Candidatus Woesearchaeota archaeon]|nr:4,5-DOPA dioxygenase extradiol [Candidatus Woesearchaeota archaeon]
MLEKKMPVLFIGHGSPLNAIETNEYTINWKRIADQIQKPKAILCISAHWLKEGTAVTAMGKPKTIHDFYGFPEQLYKLRYQAKGSLKLAKQIQEIVKTVHVELDQEWGFDHGTWAVLMQMYPKANIPVVQLSLDYQLPLEKVVGLGKELSVLRKKGILIIGSGNLVHNLMQISPGSAPFLWAVEFDAFVKENVKKRDDQKIINYLQHPAAVLAQPTNDHYLPLLYILGAAEKEEPSFCNEKIIYSSIGMRCVLFGMKLK